MLMLLFYAGKDAYAIDSQYIEEVFPNVNLKIIPQSKPFVSGLLNINGQLVKTIDINKLMINEPCSFSLNTRIILLSYADINKAQEPCAIIAEHAIEMIDCSREGFVSQHIENNELPFLKGVLKLGTRTIQLFDVPRFFEYLKEISI